MRLFDVRRAGHTAAAAELPPLTVARADRLVLEADLDDDGSIDPASAERTTWVCNAAVRRLSRLLGGQSMPIADGAVGCTFTYLAADESPLVPPASGLDPAALARVALVVLDLRLAPRGGGLVARRVAVALRGRP